MQDDTDGSVRFIAGCEEESEAEIWNCSRNLDEGEVPPVTPPVPPVPPVLSPIHPPLDRQGGRSGRSLAVVTPPVGRLPIVLAHLQAASVVCIS